MSVKQEDVTMLSSDIPSSYSNFSIPIESDTDILRVQYDSMCRDLNMDIQTLTEAWLSYIHIRRHYVLEGDQLHWLACSLYVACRTTTIPTISGLGNETCNSISLDRLLKSAHNLQLIVFFDKLHKWQDMANLPETLRKNIGQLENSFDIVSIVYQKYTQMFTHIYGQITNFKKNSGEQVHNNPKLLKNKRSQQSVISQHDLYSLCWSLFSLTKSKFPTISNDLVSAYHLLVACMNLFYVNVIQSKLNHLLKGAYTSSPTDNSENDVTVSHGCSPSIIEELCSHYSGRVEDCRTISEHYLKTYLKRLLIKGRLKGDLDTYTSLLHPIEHFQINLREINRSYDEIVLTRCVIDERIFLTSTNDQAGLTPLYDLVTSLNENRTCLKPKTPLTNRSRYVLGINGHSTPISIANQMLSHIAQIIGNLTNAEPSTNLKQIIKNQIHLDSLIKRVNDWKQVFYQEYTKSLYTQTPKRDIDNGSNEENVDDHQSEEYCRWSKARMDMSVKLFYHCLDEILTTERKHLQQHRGLNEQVSCTEACNKLLMKDEFIKSLFALCLDLVLYSYHDKQHDYKWILNLYQLDAFLFVKIIEIFIQAIKQIRNSREFIKHMNSMEEQIILHMAWIDKSQIWNEIEKRGILMYDDVKKPQQTVVINPQLSSSITTPTHASGLYLTNSPISLKAANKSADSLSTRALIKRSKSDNMNDRLPPPSPNTMATQQKKNGPYLMFYRKLYTIVSIRLHTLCQRLNTSPLFLKIVWNTFLSIFYKHIQLLRSRHLDQILICCIYLTSNKMCVPLSKSKSLSEHSYTSNGKISLNPTQQQSKSLMWSELIKVYKSVPGAEEHVLRSVVLTTSTDILTIDELSNEYHPSSTILTPSKPAGTRIRIGNELHGDIRCFYDDIFLKHAMDTVQSYYETHKVLSEFPRELLTTTISNQNIFSSPRKIQIGGESSFLYSNKSLGASLLPKLIPTNRGENQSPCIPFTSTSNSFQATNVLSSSIQTGQAQITTTKTRTPNGKFITIMTGSTATKQNVTNQQENADLLETNTTPSSSSYEQQIVFGKLPSKDLRAINSYLASKYNTTATKEQDMPANSFRTHSNTCVKRKSSEALLEQEDEIEEIILDSDNTSSTTNSPGPKQQNGSISDGGLNSITQKLLLLHNDRQREQQQQQQFVFSPQSLSSSRGSIFESNNSLTYLSTLKLPTPINLSNGGYL
ncbi:unnamed protein product [Didymodactylos carnosus]|uniref:Uncharacterized protein n=2 Tax=Didymodactylos carnosus TaxID=1234261 RepID=A0A814FWX1_9BILA|nr:unnamed protein product [Didymodactylos carnosus]CAF3760194.1 unnamed protein product [Didymodactylos carnosus]